jgi:hypothetical protein
MLEPPKGFKFALGQQVARPRMPYYVGIVRGHRLAPSGRREVDIERFCPLLLVWTWRWLFEDELVAVNHLPSPTPAVAAAAIECERQTPRTYDRFSRLPNTDNDEGVRQTR